MCDYCHLDELTIFDVPNCIICSLTEIFDDIREKKMSIDTFAKKDRIYYILMLIIIILIIKELYSILVRNKNEESYHTSWEEYSRWYS